MRREAIFGFGGTWVLIYELEHWETHSWSYPAIFLGLLFFFFHVFGQ